MPGFPVDGHIYRSSNLKRCSVCAYKKSSSRSTRVKDKKIKTWCPKCNVHLCVGKCFEAYHSRVNYKNSNVESRTANNITSNTSNFSLSILQSLKCISNDTFKMFQLP